LWDEFPNLTMFRPLARGRSATRPAAMIGVGPVNAPDRNVGRRNCSHDCKADHNQIDGAAEQ
jgi:hypothetical protein